MTRYRFAIAAVLGLLIVSIKERAAAEDCPPTDTIAICFNRLAGEPPPAAEAPQAQKESREKARTRVEERLGRFVTGLGIEDSGARSAVTDFLALLAVAGEVGNVDPDEAALSLSFSNPIKLPIGDYKIQATFNDPTFFEPLKETIPEADRATVVDDLEPSLDDVSDVLVTATWGLNAELQPGFRVGRSFGEPEQREFGQIYDALYKDVRDGGALAAKQAEDDRLQNFLDHKELDWETTSLAEAEKKLTPGEFGALMTLLRGNVSAFSTFDKTLSEVEDRLEIDRFAELVNNQPQLTVNGGFRLRDELAGQNEYSVQLQFEVPLDTNLNDYLRYKSGHCAALAFSSHSCWKSFVAEELHREGDVAEGDRLSLSINYAHLDDYDHSLNTANGVVNLMLDAQDTLDLAATYGRFLSVLGTDPSGTRVDLSLMYKETFGAKDMQDRIVGSATLTRRLIGGAAVVFGIGYANKPEFRQESDNQVTTNIGLVYRFVES